ncbi:MAG: hypothetical protein R6W78_01545 [Bacteroidales bacterium]
MYLESIVTYLTWPVLIVVSYYVVRYTIKRLENKEERDGIENRA